MSPKELEAAGARAVAEAARAAKPDPHELLPASERELAAMLETGVGREFGLHELRVSRDGRRMTFILGPPGSNSVGSPNEAATAAALGAM